MCQVSAPQIRQTLSRLVKEVKSAVAQRENGDRASNCDCANFTLSHGIAAMQ